MKCMSNCIIILMSISRTSHWEYSQMSTYHQVASQLLDFVGCFLSMSIHINNFEPGYEVKKWDF